MNVDEYWISPIEKYDNLYLKRDDYFSPFKNGVNGGKVRQAISLIRNNLDVIRNKYNNTIITTTSVNSPQGVIIATVAKYFGVKAIIGYGYLHSKEKLIKNNRLVEKAYNTGADIQIIANASYNNVTNKAVEKIANENNYFLIKFGINGLNNPDSIFGVIEKQVENIPDVDNLVIPVGSGLNFVAIMRGIKKYKPKIKRIIGVLSGADSTNTIKSFLKKDKILNINDDYFGEAIFTYELYKSPLKYNQKKFIDEPIEFDPIYEVKSYLWIKDNLPDNEKTLLWIVGNQRKTY